MFNALPPLPAGRHGISLAVGVFLLGACVDARPLDNAPTRPARSDGPAALTSWDPRASASTDPDTHGTQRQLVLEREIDLGLPGASNERAPVSSIIELDRVGNTYALTWRAADNLYRVSILPGGGASEPSLGHITGRHITSTSHGNNFFWVWRWAEDTLNREVRCLALDGSWCAPGWVPTDVYFSFTNATVESIGSSWAQIANPQGSSTAVVLLDPSTFAVTHATELGFDVMRGLDATNEAVAVLGIDAAGPAVELFDAQLNLQTTLPSLGSLHLSLHGSKVITFGNSDSDGGGVKYEAHHLGADPSLITSGASTIQSIDTVAVANHLVAAAKSFGSVSLQAIDLSTSPPSVQTVALGTSPEFYGKGLSLTTATTNDKAMFAGLLSDGGTEGRTVFGEVSLDPLAVVEHYESFLKRGFDCDSALIARDSTGVTVRAHDEDQNRLIHLDALGNTTATETYGELPGLSAIREIGGETFGFGMTAGTLRVWRFGTGPTPNVVAQAAGVEGILVGGTNAGVVSIVAEFDDGYRVAVFDPAALQLNFRALGGAHLSRLNELVFSEGRDVVIGTSGNLTVFAAALDLGADPPVLESPQFIGGSPFASWVGTATAVGDRVFVAWRRAAHGDRIEFHWLDWNQGSLSADAGTAFDTQGDLPKMESVAMRDSAAFLVWESNDLDGSVGVYGLHVRADASTVEFRGTRFGTPGFDIGNPSLASNDGTVWLATDEYRPDTMATRVVVRKLAAGDVLTAPCSDNANCASGFCVDGLCCEKTCGVCERCGSTGACEPVTNERDDACATDSTCDAAGQCKPDLGNACVAGSDCASGFCVDGVCCNSICEGACQRCDAIGAHSDGLPGVCSSVAESCGGFTCDADAACRDSCNDSSECLPGHQCTSAGHCDPIGPGAADADDGCSCSSVGRPSSPSIPSWLALFGLAAALRRRRQASKGATT